MGQSNVPTDHIDLIPGPNVISNPNEVRLSKGAIGLQASVNGALPVAVGGNTILSRAQSLAPTAGFNTVMGTDFDNDQWWTTVVTNGTATVSQTDKAGVLTLDTTGTGSSKVSLTPHGKPSHVDNMKTTPFYATWRVKFGTAIDAQGYVACAITNPAGIGNPAVYFGALGTQSTTNWGFELYDNAGVLQAHGASSVALDTVNWHTVEVVNDGTNYNLILDGTVLFTQAASVAGTNAASLQMFAGNGSTAASRTIKVDSMWIALASN